jgi:hypothetical protein
MTNLPQRPQRPQEILIQNSEGEDVKALRTSDGTIWINMTEGKKYTGFSQYMIFDRVSELEEERKQSLRQQFKGKSAYVRQEDLDELMRRVYDPKPIERKPQE